VADVVLQFRYVRIWFVYLTFQISPGKISPSTKGGRGREWGGERNFLWGLTRYRNWRTTSATQLQPSKSLCYTGYTSTLLDVRSCVLMQEATTCSIFYDGISFQHLATVLISLFTLCYGPGLLFRGPSCIYIYIYIYIYIVAERCIRNLTLQLPYHWKNSTIKIYKTVIVKYLTGHFPFL